MATRSAARKDIEILLVRAEVTALPERRLLKSRHLVSADLLWPRPGIARRSAAREAHLRKGVVDFSSEPWAKRILFREQIDGHAALAVSITEPVSVQKLKRFVRLTAKYAFRMGAEFMEKAMVGYADIASAPLDALSAMVGEKDAPEAIAQGVIDVTALPAAGKEISLDIPLVRPGSGKAAGTVRCLLRG
jgi:hypothetical protein